MTRHLASIAAVAMLVGTAACSKPAAPADDLAQDLAAASGSSVELAPRSSGTQIVSDIEQTPQRTPARAPTVKAPAPRPAPRQTPAPVAVASAPEVVAPAPVPAPTPVVAQAPAPSPEPVIATPRPTPAPQGSPARRGGYSSVSDVIRRAPFPITP